LNELSPAVTTHSNSRNKPRPTTGWGGVRGLFCVGLVCVALGCSQAQDQSNPAGTVQSENPQTPVDPKKVEEDWTKERMEQAKPMPTPTIIVGPDGQPLPADKPADKGAPGGVSGSQ
jgi:hypothetical protein